MHIEVRYADVNTQIIVPLQVEQDCTLQQALELAIVRIKAQTAQDLDVINLNVGVNGVRAKNDAQILQEYDLVDICQPLLFDPKQRRKLKAVQQQSSVIKLKQNKAI